MSITVTVVDDQTSETETKRVEDGDYLLIPVWPCRMRTIQSYPAKGVHVITIDGRRDPGSLGPSSPKQGDVVEIIADQLMDLRMDGPWSQDGRTTYQEAMRHYAVDIARSLGYTGDSSSLQRSPNG